MSTVRIQFEIPEDRLKQLDAMREKAGMKTRTEMFNNAMSLLKWVIDQIEDGRAIASMDYENKSHRELQMPFFDNIEVNNTQEAPVGAGQGR